MAMTVRCSHTGPVYVIGSCVTFKVLLLMLLLIIYRDIFLICWLIKITTSFVSHALDGTIVLVLVLQIHSYVISSPFPRICVCVSEKHSNIDLLLCFCIKICWLFFSWQYKQQIDFFSPEPQSQRHAITVSNISPGRRI